MNCAPLLAIHQGTIQQSFNLVIWNSLLFYIRNTSDGCVMLSVKFFKEFLSNEVIRD